MKTNVKRRSAVGTAAVILVAVIVILIAGAAYYLLSARSGNATTTSLAPKTVHVSMPSGVGTNKSLNFQPANITLVIGVNNSVIWTNGDSAPHTVTATSVPSGASMFNSGNMNSGATFVYTFTVPGTYKYDCTYHSIWMQGIVIVKQTT
jgi:plastocyanin